VKLSDPSLTHAIPECHTGDLSTSLDFCCYQHVYNIFNMSCREVIMVEVRVRTL